MITLAQLTRELTHSEELVATFAILFMAVVGVWFAARRFLTTPVTPDPWSPEIAEELERPDCGPICHRCLAPHEFNAHFCPNCGAPVNACTNLMPLLYIYSIGDALRAGTNENCRKSPMSLLGFIALGGAAGFLLPVGPLFSLVYWAKLFSSSRGASGDIPPPLSDSGLNEEASVR